MTNKANSLLQKTLNQSTTERRQMYQALIKILKLFSIQTFQNILALM